MTSGTYTLLIEVKSSITVKFGAAGEYTLQDGLYSYTGSAPNESFARVDRHYDLSSGNSDVRHWHIDYLLGSASVVVIGHIKTSNAVECPVATRLSNIWEPVNGLGASDCSCQTHLHKSPSNNVSTVAEELKSAYDSLCGEWEYLETSSNS